MKTDIPKELTEFLDQTAKENKLEGKIIDWGDICALPNHYPVVMRTFNYDVAKKYSINLKTVWGNEKIAIYHNNKIYFLYGCGFYGEYKYPKNFTYLATVPCDKKGVKEDVLYLISHERQEKLKKEAKNAHATAIRKFRQDKIQPIQKEFEQLAEHVTKWYFKKIVEDFTSKVDLNIFNMKALAKSSHPSLIEDMFRYYHLMNDQRSSVKNNQRSSGKNEVQRSEEQTSQREGSDRKNNDNNSYLEIKSKNKLAPWEDEEVVNKVNDNFYEIEWDSQSDFEWDLFHNKYPYFKSFIQMVSSCIKGNYPYGGSYGDMKYANRDANLKVYLFTYHLIYKTKQ